MMVFEQPSFRSRDRMADPDAIKFAFHDARLFVNEMDRAVSLDICRE